MSEAPDNTKGLAEICIGVLVVICCCAAMAAGCAPGIESGRNQMQHEAIEHGYARYSETTGQWEWKGEAK
jgi:hypothetical protein